MEHLDTVHSIITTKSPDDWSYMRTIVKEKYDVDISHFVPVFLVLKDFDIIHDPSFKAADIVSSWWSRGKMPIVLLKSLDEWYQWDPSRKSIIESVSVFID